MNLKNSFFVGISLYLFICVVVAMSFSACTSSESNKDYSTIKYDESCRIKFKEHAVFESIGYTILEIDSVEYLSTGDGIIRISK